MSYQKYVGQCIVPLNKFKNSEHAEAIRKYQAELLNKMSTDILGKMTEDQFVSLSFHFCLKEVGFGEALLLLSALIEFDKVDTISESLALGMVAKEMQKKLKWEKYPPKEIPKHSSVHQGAPDIWITDDPFQKAALIKEIPGDSVVFDEAYLKLLGYPIKAVATIDVLADAVMVVNHSATEVDAAVVKNLEKKSPKNRVAKAEPKPEPTRIDFLEI